MRPFKQFIYGQRRIDLSEPYIHLYVNVAPKLYEYLQAIEDIQFADGSYHKYCGEIKNVVNYFITYWTDVINKSIKEADTVKKTATKEKLLRLIDNSKKVQQIKQTKFTHKFLPAEDEYEQEIYDEIDELYKLRIADLTAMAESAQHFGTQEVVDEFINHQVEISIKMKNHFFSLCHLDIAILLANRTHRIKVSFEDILQRVRGNLKRLNAEKSAHISKLMEEMYEANKTKLMASRQDRHRNTDTYELEIIIQNLRQKIESVVPEKPIVYLMEEVNYWEKRMKDFLEIESVIVKAKLELEKIKNYLIQYDALSCRELPGAKQTCWVTIGENLWWRKDYLEGVFNTAAKALMTFFAIRGHNRIFYKNNYGKYAVDDYGHQVYVSNYCKVNNHVKCDGSFVEYTDLDKYFFDKFGRYVLDEQGEKLYQRASCGSTYKLNEHTLFVKNTKDCGHSEAANPDCKMNLADPNAIELLPMVDQVDVKNTLSPEVVKYLWEGVGHILPDALFDTYEKRPRNPIYYIGHRLLQHKYYKKTVADLKTKKDEAKLFAENIYQARKKSAAESMKAWMEKQPPRCKTEESDDTETRMFLDNYEKQANLVAQVTAYYD